MSKKATVKSVETLSCDAGWRNYHFVKVTTEGGIVGWSEFDEGFGAPGLGTAIQKLATRVVGQNGNDHERIYQAVRRAVRYGQTDQVRVYVPYIPEMEGLVFSNVKRKEQRFMEEVALQEAHYQQALQEIAA